MQVIDIVVFWIGLDGYVYFYVQFIVGQYGYVFVNLFFVDIIDVYDVLWCDYMEVWIVDIFFVQAVIKLFKQYFVFFGFNGQKGCIGKGQDSDEGYKDDDVVCD